MQHLAEVALRPRVLLVRRSRRLPSRAGRARVQQLRARPSGLRRPGPRPPTAASPAEVRARAETCGVALVRSHPEAAKRAARARRDAIPAREELRAGQACAPPAPAGAQACPDCAGQSRAEARTAPAGRVDRAAPLRNGDARLRLKLRMRGARLARLERCDVDVRLKKWLLAQAIDYLVEVRPLGQRSAPAPLDQQTEAFRNRTRNRGRSPHFPRVAMLVTNVADRTEAGNDIVHKKTERVNIYLEVLTAARVELWRGEVRCRALDRLAQRVSRRRELRQVEVDDRSLVSNFYGLYRYRA
jgi:hypothetical protein